MSQPRWPGPRSASSATSNKQKRANPGPPRPLPAASKMTPTSVGLRRAARGMWNAAARLGIKAQPAMPWSKEVVASLPWGTQEHSPGAC